MVLNMTEKGLAYANPFLVKKIKKSEKGIKYFISMSIYYTSNDRLLNEKTTKTTKVAWKPRLFQGGMNYGSTTQYDSNER